MTRQTSESTCEEAAPPGPVTMLPGQAWSLHSEYTYRTSDAEVLRVGDYLRARGLLEGPSPNWAWARRRRKGYTRLARRRGRGAGEAA